MTFEKWTRRTSFCAALCFALAFLSYAVTACRTIYPGDSPELVTAAWTFGIPHPPGYPLYTLLTGLWTHALAFLEPLSPYWY